MAETCDHCGAPMEDWSASHCSEECLLYDLRNSTSYHDDSTITELVARMRTENRYDIHVLEKLR